METVCKGKQWDVLLAWSGGQVCGAMPFLFGKRLGIKYILQPQLTPWSGPWLRDGLDAAARQATLETLASALRAQKALLCMQRFAPGMTDCQPFTRLGFRQTARRTYRFDPLQPVDVLMKGAQPQRRKRMALLREECSTDRAVGVDEFTAFHNSYHLRRSGKNIVGTALVEAVCAAALDRGQGLIYGLRDAAGRLLTADFVVYDEHCAYSLLSGLADGAPRNCTTLLFWEILDALQDRTAAFDFEGSMDPGTEQFFSSFGATRTPLIQIEHSRIPFIDRILL